MISTIICTIEDPDDRVWICRLYETYEPLMFWATGKYLKNVEDRRDALQDAVVALIQNLETIKTLEPPYLRTYIVCTVESRSINLAKRRNLELRLFDNLDRVPVEPAANLTEDHFWQLSAKKALSDIWPKLSAQERVLLESKYILGYQDREIGELLGCKASSVRMYLTRARRKAMELLTEVNQLDSL